MKGKTYRIGEAALVLHLKSYVLRFWETEFPELTPLRTEKGQRLYTEQHLELLKRIRYLLHERGMTIEGARRHLAEEDKAAPLETAQDAPASPCLLAAIEAELLEIRQMLQPDDDKE